MVAPLFMWLVLRMLSAWSPCYFALKGAALIWYITHFCTYSERLSAMLGCSPPIHGCMRCSNCIWVMSKCTFCQLNVQDLTPLVHEYLALQYQAFHCSWLVPCVSVCAKVWFRFSSLCIFQESAYDVCLCTITSSLLAVTGATLINRTASGSQVSILLSNGATLRSSSFWSLSTYMYCMRSYCCSSIRIRSQ